MTLTPSSSSPSIDALRDVRAASCGPVGSPAVTSDLSENVILTTLDDLHNWARLSSLWPLLYGTACCFIEFAALIGSRFDFDRFGLVPRSSPRQADLLIVAGTVTMKMAPALVRLYEQMPEPKYVIAMGACTITGGMFSADSTTAVRGVDKLIPVDLYLPGCPPRPEAIFDAVIKLRKKVGNEALAERGRILPTHRYCTVAHQMKAVEPIVTGAYLAAETQRQALAAAAGLPLGTLREEDAAAKAAIDAASSPAVQPSANSPDSDSPASQTDA
ncbi:NADH-quinone oxidoreductase subunit NuoB [Cyanobium sp. PCC 7001]|uniref:NADH-quinone oxidoreductase subunit NuoB n=1 Tax=Cyanobium sp. PCC 7001 TaxID=180281 RepID=UPI0005B78072|nr:NADH-quinone oxidoreductase subunit NuoB [Cyanobium sp. PCC 7001]